LTHNFRRGDLPATVALLFFVACSHAWSSSEPNADVYDAWREQRSYVEVTAQGSAARIFGIRKGPSGAHEGFLLHLRGAAGHGLTVKVEDNIDITGPVPLQAGDDVELRGEYIYDPRGGIIHYTHHDPRGAHPPGYIRVRGRTYT
jgi:Protein of unknown function (DUF3465)